MQQSASAAIEPNPLLQAVLQHADRLNLSADQEARLSRLYWSIGLGDRSRDTQSEIEQILDDQQLRFLVSDAASGDTPRFQQIMAEAVDRRVDETINRKLKNASVVENEVATAVLEKITAWAKLFSYFVAIPLGLLLLIFALFGWQSFNDVRRAADNVRVVISSSQAEIDRSRTALKRNSDQARALQQRLNRLNEELAPLIETAQGQIQQSDAQLSALQEELQPILENARRQAQTSQAQIAQIQRQLAANAQQLSGLNTTVQRLAEAVGFEETGALPSLPAPATGQPGRAAAELVNCAIGEYNQNVRENGGDRQIRTYLQTLGFPPDTQIAWSGAFISYCLRRIGADSQIRPSAANRNLMLAAQRSGIWTANGPNVRPRPGDIYFISRENRPTMGIGIIRRVNGSDFEGLEGNVGDRISLVPRSLSTPRLEGFARLRDQ